MDILRATEILKGLADGVDPLTGELLPDQSVCNQAEVVRAFHCILRELEWGQQRRERKKKLPENAGKPWKQEDDDVLIQMFDQGCSKREIQGYFKRTEGSITSRLVRLGKINEREQFRNRS